MSDGVEVYTLVYTPFVMGGSVWQPRKTVVEDFLEVDFGKGITGVLFYNPVRDLWHIAEKQSGGIVGTRPTDKAVLEAVKKDLAEAEMEVVERQIAKAQAEMKQAKTVSFEKFCSLFKRR